MQYLLENAAKMLLLLVGEGWLWCWGRGRYIQLFWGGGAVRGGWFPSCWQWACSRSAPITVRLSEHSWQWACSRSAPITMRVSEHSVVQPPVEMLRIKD